MSTDNPNKMSDRIKWTMHNSNHFTGEKSGYVIDLKTGGWPMWVIIKDGVVVDNCMYHPPASSSGNSELAGKVQSEKYLDLLINPTEDVNR